MSAYWLLAGIATLAIAVFAYVMPGFRRAWVSFVGLATGIMMIATSISAFPAAPTGSEFFAFVSIWASAVTIFLVGVKAAWKGI